MIKEEFGKIIEVLENTDINNYEAYEELWNKEIALFSSNLEETVSFIENEISADQLSWFCEILESLVEKTKSERIISSVENAVKKYPEEEKKYNLQGTIRSAKIFIENKSLL